MKHVNVTLADGSWQGLEVSVGSVRADGHGSSTRSIRVTATATGTCEIFIPGTTLSLIDTSDWVYIVDIGVDIHNIAVGELSPDLPEELYKYIPLTVLVNQQNLSGVADRVIDFFTREPIRILHPHQDPGGEYRKLLSPTYIACDTDPGVLEAVMSLGDPQFPAYMFTGISDNLFELVEAEHSIGNLFGSDHPVGCTLSTQSKFGGEEDQKSWDYEDLVTFFYRGVAAPVVCPKLVICKWLGLPDPHSDSDAEDIYIYEHLGEFHDQLNGLVEEHLLT